MLNYTDIRHKIKSGDVLAWSGGSWKTLHGIQVNLVRMATMSEYSHVGVAWVVGGRVFVIEAVVPQVRIYPLSKEIPFYWISCGKDYWNNDIEQETLSKVGDKYSKYQAIMAFFHSVALGTDKKWQCAEFVGYLLNKGGLFDKYIATPTFIVNNLLDKGYTITKVTK